MTYTDTDGSGYGLHAVDKMAAIFAEELTLLAVDTEDNAARWPDDDVFGSRWKSSAERATDTEAPS